MIPFSDKLSSFGSYIISNRPRHAGDLINNIKADEHGKVKLEFFDEKANLLDFNTDKDKLKTIQKTINMLEGTFSLIIIFLNEPNTLYITKRGSPLLLSYNNNMALITSEESGFNKLVKRIFNYLVFCKIYYIIFFIITLIPQIT